MRAGSLNSKTAEICTTISAHPYHDDLYASAVALANIVANLPARIYWKNKSGVILGCNNESATSFGLEKAQKLIGKTIFDLVEKESAQRIYESDLRVMKTGETEVVEELVMIEGKKHTFISHKSPFKNPETDEVTGILGVSIDITKQKELEADYEERMRELAVALEVKKDFLNNMRHEIATPLVGFMNMTEELEHSWDKIAESERKECLKHILNGRDRLMSMLSNLLDLSKFQQGKLSFEFNPYDIRYLIIEVVEEFKDLTHPIDMDILSNADTNVHCDPWRIKQLLRNVLANAIKHGGKDKSIRIILDRHQENDLKYLKISVQDEGVGIPEDQLQTIFEPFTESSRTKRKSGGTGVGLTLCKDIVGAHKGKIWAENNASGVGSTFRMILPYEKQFDKVYTYRLTQRS